MDKIYFYKYKLEETYTTYESYKDKKRKDEKKEVVNVRVLDLEKLISNIKKKKKLVIMTIKLIINIHVFITIEKPIMF